MGSRKIVKSQDVGKSDVKQSFKEMASKQACNNSNVNDRADLEGGNFEGF